MNNKEQAQEYLNAIKDNTYDLDTIIEWLYNYECEHCTDFNIVDVDTLDIMVETEAQRGGFVRVAHFLAGIEWLNMNYYRIDGYGNARDIEASDLECWLQDIINGDYE